MQIVLVMVPVNKEEPVYDYTVNTSPW